MTQNLPAPIEDLVKAYEELQARKEKKKEYYQREDVKKRECEKQKKFYAANRERILARQNGYYQDEEKKERIRERNKAWYLANREKILERERAKREAKRLAEQA